MLAGLVVLASAGFGLLRATPAAAATCGAPVPGHARVIVVVDDGTGSVSTECVVVVRGTNGSGLLRQRAAQLGTAVPSHAGSGLLCTIDSFPSSGCSETANGSYWANFSGSGAGWDYSSYNPFIRRVCDGDIEGWRYVLRGSGGAGDASPRLAPAAVALPDAWGCEEPATIAPPAGEGEVAVERPGASTDVAEASVADADGAPILGSDEEMQAPGRSGDRAATATGAAAGVTADAAASPEMTSQSASTSWIALVGALALIVGLGSAAFLRSRRTT